MSKTDKHRPPRVQIADKYVARHDHSNGECNLPTLDRWLKEDLVRRWGMHDCYYEPRNWHTDVAFRRSKGEGEWIQRKATRKYRTDWKSEGLADLADLRDNEPDEIEGGCQNGCCG